MFVVVSPLAEMLTGFLCVKGIEMTIEELVIRCEQLGMWAKLLKNCQPENRDYLMKTLMVESTRTADACQEYYLHNYGGANKVLKK